MARLCSLVARAGAGLYCSGANDAVEDTHRPHQREREMQMADCANKERNADACPCTSKGCERRGMCCECVRQHREAGVLPACLLHLAPEAPGK